MVSELRTSLLYFLPPTLTNTALACLRYEDVRLMGDKHPSGFAELGNRGLVDTCCQVHVQTDGSWELTETVLTSVT